MSDKVIMSVLVYPAVEMFLFQSPTMCLISVMLCFGFFQSFFEALDRSRWFAIDSIQSDVPA